MSQLPLALGLAHHARFATFVAGRNSAALEHVRAVAGGAGETLWLWGGAGTGKTHLLQAACRAAADADRRAMYLPLGSEPVTPEVLGGLEHLDFLALDCADRAAGRADWERRLFVILDEFGGRRGSLLLASRAAAPAAGFVLPDLASRAAGAVSYRLHSLDDGERADALIAHAEARGLGLERSAAEYLLHRVERDMGGLELWLERLDAASLAQGRRLTIPFIRDVLAGFSAESD